MRYLLRISLFIFVFILPQTVFGSEKVFFYHTDAAGTPVAITNSAGAVIWRADYKPFGEEFNVTGTSENNKRFIGKEKDSETGLDYFGARYMKTDIGRFISPDPVGAVDPNTSATNYFLLENPQIINPYSYSLNNPYRFIDPDGKRIILATSIIPKKGESRYSLLDDPMLDLLPTPLALESEGMQIFKFLRRIFSKKLETGIMQKIFYILHHKGFYDLESMTLDEANALGKTFVGENAKKLYKKGVEIGISNIEETRIYRYPTKKFTGVAAGKTQANIEEITVSASGKRVTTTNVHIEIKE